MALLKYLKPVDGLPDPKGSLTAAMSSAAIAEANKEVQKAIRAASGTSKRGPYFKMDSSLRCEIAKYAGYHGAAESARNFSRKLDRCLSVSTVKSIKKSYVEELRKRARTDDGDEIMILPVKKRGRKLLLGQDLDQMVQLYLRKVRDGGGAVSARIVMAAARGILLKCNRSLLAEFGGPVLLNKYWAHSLLKRMKFVQRKATTSKSKYTVANFAQVKRRFLNDVATTVEMEEIKPELVLNWDQTGIKFVPCSSWTMERQGEKRVELVGINDKRQITAVFCGSLVGDFLPVQLVYKGKTPRCHPRFTFPSGWHITHSPNHWSTEATMLQYLEHIILPYVENVRETVGSDEAALVIIDNFKGQITSSVNMILEQNNIHVCLLPPNTTDLLQPMDISVNKPAKEFLKRKFEQWYSDKVIDQLEGRDMDDLETSELQPINLAMPVLKEVGAEWLVEMADYISDNPQFIVNGFVRSGIAGAADGEDDKTDNESSGSDDESPGSESDDGSDSVFSELSVEI